MRRHTGAPWPRALRVVVLTALVSSAAAAPTMAQTADFVATDVTMGRIVRGQPFSADGVTTLTQVLADGTRIERTAESKFYRDSQGRVRREQTVLGLSTLNRSGAPVRTISIVDPVAGVAVTLYQDQQAARREILGRQAAAPPSSGREIIRDGRTVSFRPSGEGNREASVSSLGTRTVEGLTASGVETKLTIPVRSIGNDRPIEITSERWTSEELGLLLQSRDQDPRSGTVEFRLTNKIGRASCRERV